MLVSMKEMLLDAKRSGYAVGSYNALDLLTTRGIIAAAEAEKSPVILAFAQGHSVYTPLEEIAPILLGAAKRSSVPVSVIFDHGQTFDAIVRALQLGFNAVMFDGSSLSYSQNVLQTREIVKIARVFGAEVEAELGHVSHPEGESRTNDTALLYDETLYTVPQQAKQFVEETGIDVFASAFGTAHGIYDLEPKLDINRLKQIRDCVSLPLVMHGGSGLSDADFCATIDAGITKINYYTSISVAAGEGARQYVNSIDGRVFYNNLMGKIVDAVAQNIAPTMKLFGSSNRA